MIWLRQVALILAAVTLAVCRLRSGSPAAQPFFFIQMSDPQFGFFTPNAGFAQETANFEKAIAAANRLRPAFVVVTGDLTHRQGDAAQIAEYQRIAKQLDRSIPMYPVPGNHDIALPMSPASVTAYRAAYGPDFYTFDAHGVRGVVLNSSLIKEGANAPAAADSQTKWLRSAVASAHASGKQVIVFQHHPWFMANDAEADSYNNLPLATRRGWLDLFAQNGVRHIFAGHYHGNASGRSGEIEMITSGPVGKPLRGDPSGIRVVFVDGARVTHRYYPLDSIPQSVAALRP